MILRAIITDAIVAGIEAWKANDESAMDAAIERAASAIEAPSGVETGNTDSTEGESLVGESRDAQ